MTISESKQYIRDRITMLRMARGVSEYRMSLDLGRSKGYVQGISSGKSLPSMDVFLSICEYFGISAADFFDVGKSQPALLNRLNQLAEALTPEDLKLVVDFAERLAGQNTGNR